jgi:hypothetical protein
MGSWGTGIFDDDTAMDIRGAYRDAVIEKVADEEAEARAVALIEGMDDDDRSVAWIALALTEHEVGRLSDAVRDKALDWIDSGRSLAVFAELAEDEEEVVEGRRRVLAKAAEKLRSPQPKRKAIRAPKPPQTSNYPWKVGRFYGIPHEGKTYVVQVVSIRDRAELGESFRYVTDRDFVGEPVFAVLSWRKARPPKPDQIAGLAYMRISALDGTEFEEEGAGLESLQPIFIGRGVPPTDYVIDLGHEAPPPLPEAFAWNHNSPNWVHFQSVLASIHVPEYMVPSDLTVPG